MVVGEQTSFEDYLRRSALPRRVVDRFLRGPSVFTFDAQLGYVLADCVIPGTGMGGTSVISTAQADGARMGRMYAEGVRRINTYGNSFTQCAQVSDGETWQEYLAAHLGEPIGNFGISGYGAYQAYLRMVREESTTHGAENLIFYVWGDDHIRSLTRSYRTRYYDVYEDQGGLNLLGNFWTNIELDVITGQFVEHPNRAATVDDLYLMTDADWMVANQSDDLALRLCVYNLGYINDLDHDSVGVLADCLGYGYDPHDDDEGLRRQAGELLDLYSLRSTLYTLDLVREFARERNKNLMVVLFDPGRVLDELRAGGPRYDQMVVDHLQANDVTYFDMNEAQLRDFTKYNMSWSDYLDEFFVGHYNPRGNHLFAFSIKHLVVGWLDPKPVPYRPTGSSSHDNRGILGTMRWGSTV